MHLEAKHLKQLHDIACQVAQRAGAVIAEYAHQDLHVDHKDTGGSLATQVVTEVDYRCDALIREGLAESVEQFDLALLTEETEDDGLRLEKDYFWCVDPLDGTLAFTRKVHGYSVAISLISKQGESVIGVVFDPVKHDLYSAVKGQGAWLNGTAWQPVGHDDSAVANKAYQKQTLNVQLDCSFIESTAFISAWPKVEKWAAQQGFNRVDRYSEAGGVMSAIAVLCDTGAATYFKPPRVNTGGGSAWDFAATACIFKEVGAYAKDFSGKPFFFNPPGSTYMHHCGVMFASNAIIASLADCLGARPY